MIGIHHQINHNCFDHLESQLVDYVHSTMEWASGCPLCERAFHSIKIFGEGNHYDMPENDYRNMGRNETIIGTRNYKGALVGTTSWGNLLRVWSWIPSRRCKGFFKCAFIILELKLFLTFIHAEGKLAKSAHKCNLVLRYFT